MKSNSKLKAAVIGVIGLTLGAGCSSSPKSQAPFELGTQSKEEALVSTKPGVLTRRMAANRAKQVAKTSYNLWFTIDGKHEDFQGRSVLNFELRPKAKEVDPHLYLDFEEGKIESLSINGKTWSRELIASRYDSHRIQFKVDELQPGSNRIEIAFSHAYSGTGNGLYRFEDPVDHQAYLYTNFEPHHANRLMPCFDQPDLKATYELTVEAPAEWTVISNTPEIEVTEKAGLKTWAFPPSPVLSTYLFALHAGPYSVWKSDANGIPLRLFARKSLAKHVDSKEWFEITRKGLEFYASEFGVPYPFAKYDQLVVPDFNSGAMENAAAVTFSERYVFRSKPTINQRRRRADTILHEMAHMWFGDLVTMRWWNGLWLNESFASYMSALALDQTSLFNNSWQTFFSGMKKWAYWEDQLPTTHSIDVSVFDTDQAFTNFDGITYGKGAAVLKQLRFLMGEDDFREGIQRYFLRFAYRNTALADFINILTEASGMPLKEWQQTWLQIPSLNTIQVEWACGIDPKSSRSVITQLLVNQKAPENYPILRTHKTLLGLYTLKNPSNSASAKKGREKSGMSLQDSIPVEYSKAQTQVTEALGKPCPSMIFPNQGDYDYVKVELDPVSMKAVKENLSSLEDPFVRQMLWHTLWELVIDGKMPAMEFAEIALKHAGKETDTQILSSILGKLSRSDLNASSVTRFLAGSQREEHQKRVETWIKKRLDQSEAGSDLQLTLFHAYLNAASTPSATRYLKGVLTSESRIPGIKMDEERRWEIIQTLSRLGAEGAREWIAEELKKDPTALGKKESIAAEAASPDPLIKKKWFALFVASSGKKTEVSRTEYTQADLQTAMASFHFMGQEDLSKQFVEAYFEALPKIAAEEDDDYAQDFASELFPALCDPEIIQKTSEFLKSQMSSLPA